LLSLGACLAFVATALVGVRTSAGVRVDHLLADLVHNGLPAVVRQSLDSFARPLVIVVLAPVAVGLALLGLARRAWRRVLAGTVIAIASPVLALELRDRHALGVPGDAFPSNHAAAAFGLLVAVVVLWPVPVGVVGLRVALGIAVAIGIGNVSWYAHTPVDVLGSAWVVLAISAGMFALLGGDTPNVREWRVLRRREAVDPGLSN
jgi:membrane-associated phospholipid phosphatase